MSITRIPQVPKGCHVNLYHHDRSWQNGPCRSNALLPKEQQEMKSSPGHLIPQGRHSVEVHARVAYQHVNYLLFLFLRNCVND
jgi:hypothetical protein